MASANSRIPLCGPTRLKRPNENVIPHVEKKARTDTGFKSLSNQKTLRKSGSITALNTLGGFSTVAKKAVLRPQTKNIPLVRESMPVSLVRESMSIQNSVNSSKPSVPSSIVKKSKRPAWDLKGRIQDMEENFSRTQMINSDLQKQLLEYNHRIIALEQTNNELHKDVELKSVQNQETSSALAKIEKELRDKIEEMKLVIKDKDKKNKDLELENESLSLEVTRQRAKIAALVVEVDSLKSTLASLSTTQTIVQAKLNAAECECAELKTENEKQSQLIKHYEEEKKKMEQRELEYESERRKLHNTIQELKGNIRVFCRIRPLLPDEISDGLQLSHISTKEDNKTMEIARLSDCNTSEISSKSRGIYEFTFDRVFTPEATQDEVFVEISQLVQSVLDGYNVCIFAYGQTGSGKTYTMEGPQDITDFILSEYDSRLGIIPRSVQQIFTTAEQLKTKNWKYTMVASFLEIYNEYIRDLLVDNNSSTAKCEIKKSGTRKTDGYISNMSSITVTSPQQVYSLLRTARINRAVAMTHCNEYSSRSHYIFQMKLSGENSATGERCEGILNLIDLAGSERVKDSGSSGERFTEAKNINKSLSNLGNVIMALSQKADHVPYRNSKLTHLLMNCLGGSSKTLMFVNINPKEENIAETLNSLRFATKVNQCNIGTAQKRIK